MERGELPWHGVGLYHLASRARPPKRLHPVGPVSYWCGGDADRPPRRHAHVQHGVSHLAEREVAPVWRNLPPVQRRWRRRVLRGPAPVPHLCLGVHEAVHRSDGHRLRGPLRLRASLRRRRGVPPGPLRMSATGRQLQPIHVGRFRSVHGRDVHLRSQARRHGVDRRAAQKSGSMHYYD